MVFPSPASVFVGGGRGGIGTAQGLRGARAQGAELGGVCGLCLSVCVCVWRGLDIRTLGPARCQVQNSPPQDPEILLRGVYAGFRPGVCLWRVVALRPFPATVDADKATITHMTFPWRIQSVWMATPCKSPRAPPPSATKGPKEATTKSGTFSTRSIRLQMMVGSFPRFFREISSQGIQVPDAGDTVIAIVHRPERI